MDAKPLSVSLTSFQGAWQPPRHPLPDEINPLRGCDIQLGAPSAATPSLLRVSCASSLNVNLLHGILMDPLDALAISAFDDCSAQDLMDPFTDDEEDGITPELMETSSKWSSSLSDQADLDLERLMAELPEEVFGGIIS